MVAAQAGLEQAGDESFTQRQSRLLGEGFSFSGFERDALYLNLGNKKLDNISGVSGIDSISDGRGAVFADFDNDGDSDVLMTTIQDEAHLLFRNNLGQDKHFFRVSLEGTRSGRDAFGSVVRIQTAAGLRTKIKSGGAGYLSQHDPRPLFGMGDEEHIAWLEVTWPSGLVQRFQDIAADSSIQIVEGEARYRRIEEKVFQLPDPVSPEELRLQSLNIGKGALFPDVTVSDLDTGKPVKLSDVLPGNQKILVNLWATWCVPCTREMPELQKLVQRKGLAVTGISLDAPGTRDKVRQFLRRHYLRSETLVARVYRGETVSIPLSFLLDGERRVLDIYSGWSEEARTRLMQIIEQ